MGGGWAETLGGWAGSGEPAPGRGEPPGLGAGRPGSFTSAKLAARSLAPDAPGALGRREEGGSRPAAMGPGTRGRRRGLLSPLPPLPSVRAPLLFLLLAGPGATGERPGPGGWNGGGRVERKGGERNPRIPESDASGRPWESRSRAGPGAQELGTACQSPGTGTQNGGGGGDRALEAQNTGAQRRSGLGMKRPRSLGLEARSAGIGDSKWGGGYQESGARSQPTPIWSPGKVTIGALVPPGRGPPLLYKSPTPSHPQPAGLAGPRGGARGGGAKFWEL